MDFRTDPRYSKVASYLEESRGLPAGLLDSIVHAESRGNPNAVSPAGARGMVQFMPAMIKQYNVDMTDPADQLRGGADYLQDLIHQYKGNVQAAVSHYNGGGYNARQYVDGTAPDPTKVSAKNQEVNRQYVKDVMGKVNTGDTQQKPQDSGALVGQVRNYVAGLVKSGADTNAIVTQLMNNEVTAGLVREGRDSGMSYDDVVRKLAGKDAAPILDAKDKIAAQGALENVYQGGKNALQDLGNGGAQLIARATGRDDILKMAQQDQAAKEADPVYQAQMNTTGSKIGSFGVKALPYAAAAIATDGASLIPMMAAQGATGAAMGALTPTTGEGQILPNMLTEGALAAGTAGLAKGAGAAISKGANAASNAIASADARAFMSRSARQAMEQDGLSTIQRQALERIGQTGDAVTPEAIQNARSSIYSGVNGKLSQVAVPADTTSLRAELTNVLDNYRANTPKPNLSGNVAGHIDDLLQKIEQGNMTGDQLIAIRRQIANDAYNQSYAGGTKEALHKITGAIDNHLNNIAPNVAADLAKANGQWRHLQVLEKVVDRTNGQPEGLTAKNFANAVKAENRDAFQAGRAPYQDLADAAMKAYGNVNQTGLSSVAQAVHNSVADPYLAVAHPLLYAGKKSASMLINKLASRGAPNLENLIASSNLGASIPSGMPKSAIAKALAGSTTAPTAPTAPVAAPVAATNAPNPALAAKQLLLGYTPKEPVVPPTLYGAADGSVGTNPIAVTHAARVNASIPEDVLARAALKTKLANATVAAPGELPPAFHMPAREAEIAAAQAEADAKAAAAKAAAQQRAQTMCDQKNGVGPDTSNVVLTDDVKAMLRAKLNGLKKTDTATDATPVVHKAEVHVVDPKIEAYERELAAWNALTQAKPNTPEEMMALIRARGKPPVHPYAHMAKPSTAEPMTDEALNMKALNLARLMAKETNPGKYKLLELQLRQLEARAVGNKH